MKNRHCCLAIWLTLSFVPFATRDVNAQSSKTNTKKTKSSVPAKNATQNVPTGIGEFASENFVLHTDLSSEDSKELLERLEKMLALVARYYGKPNSQVIEMNVVQDRHAGRRVRFPPPRLTAS